MNTFQELLPIISLGYIINLTLLFFSIIKALYIIKKHLKYIIILKDTIKPLHYLRDKYISWQKRHIAFLSLLFPFAYIMIIIQDFYYLNKVNYNVIYLTIYMLEKDIISSGIQLTDDDKQTLITIKEKLNYPKFN